MTRVSQAEQLYYAGKEESQAIGWPRRSPRRPGEALPGASKTPPRPPLSASVRFFLAGVIGQQVAELDAPVLPHLAARDFSPVHQPDDERPGNVQQIGGLLARQLRVDRDQGHGVAVRHLGQDVEEQAKGGRRDLQRRFLAGFANDSNPQGALRSEKRRQSAARLPGQLAIRLGRGSRLETF